MQVNRRGCCSIYPRLVPFKRIRTPAPCNHRTIKTGQDILFRFSLCIPFCFVVFCLNHQQTQNKRQYYRCPCLFPKWLSHLPLSQLPSPTRSAKNKGVGPRSLCARYPRRCPGEGALPLRGVPRVEVREKDTDRPTDRRSGIRLIACQIVYDRMAPRWPIKHPSLVFAVLVFARSVFAPEHAALIVPHLSAPFPRHTLHAHDLYFFSTSTTHGVNANTRRSVFFETCVVYDVEARVFTCMLKCVDIVYLRVSSFVRHSIACALVLMYLFPMFRC